jgi:exonuclease III
LECSGLNSGAKQEDVKQSISNVRPNIVCLQETKLQQISRSTVRAVLGGEFENNFLFQPSDGAKGGLLLAARESFYTLQHVKSSMNTITAHVLDYRSNLSWTITTVYDPQGDLDKKMLIRELKNLKQVASTSWLIIGDFNLVYRDQHKNNTRVNRNMMNRFRRALNFLEVKEVELIGRNFTWSNNQSHPTLTRIDRGFCSILWEGMFINPMLQAPSSLASDHCPILLVPFYPLKVTPNSDLNHIGP